MPINLDVDQKQIDSLGIKKGARITLRDPRDDHNIAILTVEDVYKPDKLVFPSSQVFSLMAETEPGS